MVFAPDVEGRSGAGSGRPDGNARNARECIEGVPENALWEGGSKDPSSPSAEGEWETVHHKYEKNCGVSVVVKRFTSAIIILGAQSDTSAQ